MRYPSKQSELPAFHPKTSARHNLQTYGRAGEDFWNYHQPSTAFKISQTYRQDSRLDFCVEGRLPEALVLKLTPLCNVWHSKEEDTCTTEAVDAVETQSQDRPARRVKLNNRLPVQQVAMARLKWKGKLGQLVMCPTDDTCPSRSHFESAGIICAMPNGRIKEM